jgi:vacuolar-type H+-ATPase subunit H
MDDAEEKATAADKRAAEALRASEEVTQEANEEARFRVSEATAEATRLLTEARDEAERTRSDGIEAAERRTSAANAEVARLEKRAGVLREYLAQIRTALHEVVAAGEDDGVAGAEIADETLAAPAPLADDAQDSTDEGSGTAK